MFQHNFFTTNKKNSRQNKQKLTRFYDGNTSCQTDDVGWESGWAPKC